MTMIERICPCGATFKTHPSAIARGRTYCSQACYRCFVPSPRGEQKPLTWKGDSVGYAALHYWVRRERGAPTQCEFCGATDRWIEWANASHEYRRDLADWIALCKVCHMRYDNPTCRRGHERNQENTWVDKQGYPHCRLCRNERLRLQRRGRRAEWAAGNGQSSAIRRKYRAPGSDGVGSTVRDI